MSDYWFSDLISVWDRHTLLEARDRVLSWEERSMAWKKLIQEQFEKELDNEDLYF